MLFNLTTKLKTAQTFYRNVLNGYNSPSSGGALPGGGGVCMLFLILKTFLDSPQAGTATITVTKTTSIV